MKKLIYSGDIKVRIGITAYRNLHDGTRYPIGLLANDLLWQWPVSGKSTCTLLRK